MRGSSALPFVSVIIVNFDGLVFLEKCLASLRQLNYPQGRFEVILVDNGSADQSVPFVRERFSWVKITQNVSNLGFAGGNNVGIQDSKGDYIALLNNDSAVEKDWLIELVKICEEDPAIGACTSKILLMDNRLRIRLRTTAFRPSDFGIGGDSRELGVLVEEESALAGENVRTVEFSEGFYGEERFGGRRFRWSMGDAVLTIPVAPDDRTVLLQLRLSNPRPQGAGMPPVSFFVGERRLAEFKPEFEPRSFQIRLGRDVLERASAVLQNAGSIVLRDGSCRDRGAIVRNFQQVFEEDHSQYDRVEEVFAACGAGALYRRKMLEDVGLLDEYFFLYYEDIDLSWRARLKGWKIMYTPHAVMRHIHCGTSIEWSPSFKFHAYRNRLATLLKNAPLPLMCREWTKSLASLLVLGGRIVICRILRRNTAHLTASFAVRGRALRSLLLALPELWKKRREIQRTRRASPGEVTRWIQDPS